MVRWPSIVGAAASVVDRAFAAAIQVQGRRESQEADAMSHADRLAALEEIRLAYEGDALVADVARFFPAPAAASPSLREVRHGVWEAAWASPGEPFLGAVRERWLSRIENRTARARLYLTESPDTISQRPAVLAIHGFMGGQWVLEENQWPIEWFVRRGLDVALPVLPLHAGRAGARRGGPGFPSSDPRLTNEGFRQAVADLRSLVAWFRRRGAPHVGVIGMSLGGYTAALLATVSDDIDFVMPMIPLASIADFAREQGRLGRGKEADAQHSALERANWVVSPLARPLKVPPPRALVIAAEHDRITPAAHAARLATHFGCELLTMEGGHLLQLGRGDAFRGLGAMLEREGILARRGP